MSGEKLAKIDSLLEPLFLSSRDEETGELISELIAAHAEPIIKGIIRYKLHLGTQQAEAEDIYQEVLVQLLSELRQLRENPDKHAIGDIRGMAAVIAHRTCSRWMRRQFPERHALKNRLHYLLTRQRGFALWPDESGKLMAGFASWQGREKRASEEELEKLADGRTPLALLQTSSPRELANALQALFDSAGGPIEFDRVVSAFAARLQVRDQPLDSIDDGENALALRVSSGEPDLSWQIEKRIFLQRLWEELQQLPINQRAALLLNLKDEEGRGCIALFPVTGVATLRELAEALGMSAERFAELWNELPIEDARVAELLGLTRQQIINARKSGRERLARRLKAFI